MLRIAAVFLLLPVALTAAAEEDRSFEVHGQATYIRQYKPAFGAAYSGQNSLRPEREWGYTFTSTVFLGARLGDTELYFDPEVVQGASLSELHGLGGFSNGENQRVASRELQLYRARLFVRQTWNLGGAVEDQASGQNQVKTRYSAERMVLTAGNLSMLDVFDVVDYSHDPRTQFMNWASMTYGAWDYGADARGYTWGAALEYITPSWQGRVGRFLVPVESNGLKLDWTIGKRYADAAELEVPYRVAGLESVFRAMVFENRVTAGAYDDALAVSATSGNPPDVANVRTAQTKRGFGVGTQVEVSPNVGAYVRAGWSDGKTETFMFTEIDRSVAVGTLIKGASWSRTEDRAGVATYWNGLSHSHQNYLAAGGLGFFLGDGQLNYGTEKIVESFYSVGVAKGFAISVDQQRIWNPAYNHDRGPVNVFGVRLHAEI